MAWDLSIKILFRLLSNVMWAHWVPCHGIHVRHPVCDMQKASVHMLGYEAVPGARLQLQKT